MARQRVLVIGIDGATFDLIDPWVEEGRLPALRESLRNGTRAALRSTPLSNSAQAWSSFITGKNAGKHGIYDFFESLPDSYGVRFINASFRKGKSLWRLVNDAGKKVGVINVPITYPAEAVEGFLIPGLDSPGVDASFAHPPELMTEIEQRVGKYILEAGVWGLVRQGKPESALHALLAMVRTRTAAARYLMQSRDWDLFVAVYTATDKAQHHFWKYLDPRRPESRVEAPYSDAIRQVYQAVDQAIAELRQAAGDAAVVVMSDHGAGPSSRRSMYLNRWLRKEGFLRGRAAGGVGGRAQRLWYRLLAVANGQIKKRLSRRAKELLLRLFPTLRDKVDSVLSLPGIDWSRTVAYSRENHPAIFINTVGREVEGIVAPGEEYEAVRDEIVERLTRVTCPETGEKVVGRVFRREEVYHGPELARAPDLVFEWNRFRYVHRPSGMDLDAEFLETLDDRALLESENETRPSGVHRDHGVFIASGQGLKKGESIAVASLCDATATVLYLLGIRIPDDLDGRVLTEALEGRALAESPVQYTSETTEEAGPPVTVPYAEGEARNVEERLRGLGYID